MSFLQLLVGSMMILGMYASMDWLQGRFASSDHKKAIRLVSTYKPENGQALVDALIKLHPHVEKADISWSSEIKQSCLGYVRVHANLPEKASKPAVSYSFDVNLNGPSVHPSDPKTVNILKSLTQVKSSSTSAGQ
ncbi:MAG: hypothetical protein VYC39_03300 [Myxococcota bacterium]|nr:hypothetical protein [Myxococcota bacterium]